MSALRIFRVVDGRPGVTVPYPEKIAADLAAKYSALNSRAMELVDKYLIPAIASGSDARVKSAIATIERALASEFSDKKVAALATVAGKVTNGYNSRLFYGALAVAVGAAILAPGPNAPVREEKPARGKIRLVKPPPAGVKLTVAVQVDPALWSDDFVAENVKLIGDLRRGIVPGLSDAVVRAMEFGDSDPAELAARLREIWKKNGVPSTLETESGRILSTHAHALLVADDQINKLNARLNQERQLDVGIESFRWRTKGDSRVRQRHRELEGSVWTWKSGGPSGVGLPGTPVRCRCTAEAVVDRAQVLASLTESGG